MENITVIQTIECRAFIVHTNKGFYEGQTTQLKHIETRSVSLGFREENFANSPLSLNHQEIQEFKLIVKKIKDIDLTDEEAEDQAMRFVRMFRLLAENRF